MTDTPPDRIDPTAGNPLAAFAALVLGDDAVQARLGDIEIPDDFVTQAVRIAGEHGIAIDPEAIHATLRPDPLGLGRFGPAPVTLDTWPARGWLPARSVPTGGAPAFDWAWFGPEPLRTPFFDESISRYATRPLSRMLRTRITLDALIAGTDPDAPEPAGFIHHMSRCGSTLVAQMLAADPRHVVLSEPEPLDAVVRWAMESGAPLEVQVAALRAIVAALGRDRSGETQRVFFKLDSWHTMALPLFAAAFPRTPWVFLYRNPVEVLVSQQRQRGIHTVAGLLPTTIFDIPDAEGMQGDRYAAMVLARASEAVLDHWPRGGGLLVDYSELPGAIADRIAPHFGFVPDAAGRAAMAAVAGRSAKSPDQPFVPDSAAKHRAATRDIIDAARDLVDPVHARLESLRLGDRHGPA
ncbi:hypothetical protein ASE86_14615 [Sphingomonas sp. Leaf33]|uniref:sulfotransferase family protein n=1 Tax=Sphingomonas sp. Leaf33 TaxID=1736215 RepID=UPI0006FA68E4|nr:sulfotransferase family protein [Sphingomonas sp. Leaf33]KQN21204.1 hypothetical protein ASE86_14615 [Sphingomonas sp. Leaf33]